MKDDGWYWDWMTDLEREARREFWKAFLLKLNEVFKQARGQMLEFERNLRPLAEATEAERRELRETAHVIYGGAELMRIEANMEEDRKHGKEEG